MLAYTIKTTIEGKILIISLYVDDLMFTGNDELMFDEFKNSMLREFDMTDLGRMRFFSWHRSFTEVK